MWVMTGLNCTGACSNIGPSMVVHGNLDPRGKLRATVDGANSVLVTLALLFAGITGLLRSGRAL